MPNNSHGIIPGSVKINYIRLVSSTVSSLAKETDISNIIEEMNLYENLNQPFITCDIIVNDSVSLFTKLVLTGEEFLYVDFTVDHSGFSSEPYKKIFRVMAIKNIDNNKSPRNVKYILRCAEPEYFKDITTNIRKSYSDIPISEMVKKVFDNYLKITTKLTVSDTEKNKTIVIPNMNPSEAMSFFCREAKSATYKPSNYVFFSNADSFFFKTIEELLEQKYMDEYVLTPKNFGSQSSLKINGENLSKSGKPIEWMKINSFSFPKIFDIENTIKKGTFDITLYHLDLNMQRFETSQYNYIEDYDKFKRTDQTPGKFIFKNGEIGKLKTGTHQRFILSDFASPSPTDQKFETLHYKIASFSMLEYVTTEITIPGDNTRRAGDVIRISYPEFSAFDDTIGELNKYLAGDYLVVGVRHIWNPKSIGYFTVLQCMKNDYYKSPDELSKSSVKQNNTQGTSA